MYATGKQTAHSGLGPLLALLLLSLALLGSCSGGGAGLDGDESAGSGLELQLDPASFEPCGSGRIALGLEQNQEDGSLLVPIEGTQLSGLKALYCSVSYDSARYSAVQFEPAPEFDTDGGGLSLAVLGQPGLAEIGMVLKRPQEQPGLSGARQLGVLRLAQRGSARSTSLPAVQRHASSAPDGPDAAVQVTYTGQQLRWYYSNPGDYNQDGRVAVSDLTQIGLHFGETGPWIIDDAMSVVDGNGDGKISVADLTTIGLNYGHRLEHYRLLGSGNAADYPAGDNAQLYAELSMDDAIKKTNERLIFVHEMDASGMLMWVLPADGDATGTPSNVINGSGSNIAPVVTLESDYSGAAAPVTINLTATASDLDGSIVKYEFDLDGVGNLEVDNGMDNTAQIMAAAAGSYKTRVRVTDNMGAATIVTLFIEVQDDEPNAAPTVSLQSDMTSGDAPLAVHLSAFASDSDGSVVNYAFNCDGQIGDEYSGPLSGFDWTFFDEGLHVVWVTVTDDQGASAMASVDIHVGDNPVGLPPFVFCDASPASGAAPLEVMFDAGDSMDLDGVLVEFQFDFTNDGTIDKAGASPTTSYVYTQNGMYTAMVIGIDNDGNFNFVMKEIEVGGAM
ncbi:hypothetical protein IT575_14065 [bacterium]|nr:hypothetical protein [bacterium]